jgi:hypothetical protein
MVMCCQAADAKGRQAQIMLLTPLYMEPARSSEHALPRTTVGATAASGARATVAQRLDMFAAASTSAPPATNAPGPQATLLACEAATATCEAGMFHTAPTAVRLTRHVIAVYCAIKGVITHATPPAPDDHLVEYIQRVTLVGWECSVSQMTGKYHE